MTKVELLKRHRAIKSPTGKKLCYSCATWKADVFRYEPSQWPCDVKVALDLVSSDGNTN